jgi:hypothetical protein
LKHASIYSAGAQIWIYIAPLTTNIGGWTKSTLGAFDQSSDTGINAKEEVGITPVFRFAPDDKARTSLILTVKKISTFVSSPCSFIYGVFRVRMLPS